MFVEYSIGLFDGDWYYNVVFDLFIGYGIGLFDTAYIALCVGYCIGLFVTNDFDLFF